MAANGISTLATKRARQDAKLTQADADRAARNVVQPGRYAGCPVYTNARGIIDGYYMVIQHDVRMIRIRFGSRVLQCTVLSSSAATSSDQQVASRHLLAAF